MARHAGSIAGIAARPVTAMSESQESDWREVIVDHSQFPRRHGRLKQASHRATGENPFCGDRVTLELLIGPNGIVADAGFEATGCAISLASASLLVSHLVGLDEEGARSLFRTVHAMLTGGSRNGVSTEELGQELQALQLVRRYPSRVKCASLAWHAMKHALDGSGEVVTTE